MNHVDRGKKHVFGEINITPLTDIFLVLLIIVIVVAPYMTNARRDIKMPRITTGDSVEQKWGFGPSPQVLGLFSFRRRIRGRLRPPRAISALPSRLSSRSGPALGAPAEFV